ncbi:putative MRPL31-mitochondrial ribosomal protein, large subunit [Catenaria anguillulae PL171]|uniref:Putative MRPL31-mitochondrial ribosomal protein, large subunit n=1 Tax=Catenaria anguillulae PL171 TaxID=765915 RepID=A0A1Y2HI04_9FUNG|nr:putative MRPL31-mitochondrial ribosomal protein, large subunit [Catenaria anguillulae PL171]
MFGFGAFRATAVQLGGRLNKIPWRMSATRKANQRKRLRAVDDVVNTLASSGVQFRALNQALAVPTEAQMNPANKYWVFARNDPGLKKAVHKVPKFSRVEHAREWPVGLRKSLGA